MLSGEEDDLLQCLEEEDFLLPVEECTLLPEGIDRFHMDEEDVLLMEQGMILLRGETEDCLFPEEKYLLYFKKRISSSSTRTHYKWILL